MPCGRFSRVCDEPHEQGWYEVLCRWRDGVGECGEKRPQFSTNGVKTSMTFQATTKVKKPLAAASKITAKGNRIILDGVGSDSYIENKATGVRVPLKIENGVYTMEMLVSSLAEAAAPFQGRAK